MTSDSTITSIKVNLGPYSNEELSPGDVWIKIEDDRIHSKNTNVVDLEDLISRITGPTLILTNMLVYADLKDSINKLAARGFPVYIMAHKFNETIDKLKDSIIVRETDKTSCSYFVAKVNGGLEGFVFGGMLSSKSLTNDSLINLKLDYQQSEDLWNRLAKKWWSCDARERIEGKVSQKCIQRYNRFPESQIKNRRIFDIDVTPAIIAESQADKVLIEKPEHLGLLKEIYDESELTLRIDQEIHSQLRQNYGKWSSVHAKSEESGFSIISVEKGCLLLSDGFTILSNDEQTSVLEKALHHKEYRLWRAPNLKQLQMPFIHDDSLTSNRDLISVKDTEEVDLGPVSSKDMSPWLDFNVASVDLRPTLPDHNKYLARTVSFSYTVNPPTLPKASKDHSIYSDWETWVSMNVKTLDGHRTTLENELDQAKTLDKIKRKKPTEELIDRIEQLKNKIHDSKGYTQKANETKESIKTLISDVERFLIQNEDEDQTELDNLKPKEGRKKEGSSELDHVQGKKKKPKKDTEQVPEPPELNLPAVGKLYSKGSSNYLVIERIEEIIPGLEQAKNFNAELVVRE